VHAHVNCPDPASHRRRVRAFSTGGKAALAGAEVPACGPSPVWTCSRRSSACSAMYAPIGRTRASLGSAHQQYRQQKQWPRLTHHQAMSRALPPTAKQSTPSQRHTVLELLEMSSCTRNALHPSLLHHRRGRMAA
jgi:hypothetical protein